MTREQAVLDRAKGLIGVVDLEDMYHTPNDGIALLKRYVEGNTLKGRISNPTTKKQLEGTVRGLHERGFLI